ncbi:hypothetical protein BO94DRAFT_558852 [Aspergillus sclerotioniger CBS 115572]|uniref:Calcineurin-like phosphoesterase domain-containing protein n=1 Tax=Aspergillus sclerotioniger CBS 115572 TaxID=1450535 RepID=A0A317VZX4_9EURO|nr:hypothetical protein BO94DRAFT_558852 [Aspergillus sclerotioniger CBS 115572]PWY78552.1 hypothetical protein BO94DRAFT_558852 [Aspergillus sclerotioniger CBS 115572]
MLQKVWSFFQSSISFQVLSDLHPEVNRQYPSYETPGWTRLDKARQLEREPSLNGPLIVFHQKRFDIPGSCVTILGCTLWSKVPYELTDVISKKIEGWSVDDHNASQDSDLAWLLEEIHLIHKENEKAENRSKKRSILVVTHHAPLLQRTSSPQHAQNPWSVAFETDILSQTPDGVVWVFGHTHHTTDFKEGGVRVVSNQRGYVLPWNNSKTQDSFDLRTVIRVCRFTCTFQSLAYNHIS